jgi:hypothetical protein
MDNILNREHLNHTGTPPTPLNGNTHINKTWNKSYIPSNEMDLGDGTYLNKYIKNEVH